MQKYFVFVFFFLTASSLKPLHAAEFTIQSPNFKPGEALTNDQVFNSFGCHGKNISPELQWSNPPEGTRSYAIMVRDPDAPTESGWWHWVVFNIPADVKKIPAGAGSTFPKLMPQGAIQSQTDFGSPGFGGPCPPEGNKPHRYYFRIYALKDILPLKADATAAKVRFYINEVKLGEAEIMGTFGR